MKLLNLSLFALYGIISPRQWHGGGAYGLRGSCRFHFLGIHRGQYYQSSPSLALRTWLMGVLKSPGTPLECVFAGHSGGTTTCEHSRELTPGLLKLKRLVYVRHPCHLWPFSCLRATPVVMGSLATVPPGDRFLSPVPDRRGSYERGSRSTHNCLLAGFFFQLKCIMNLGTSTQ